MPKYVSRFVLGSVLAYSLSSVLIAIGQMASGQERLHGLAFHHNIFAGHIALAIGVIGYLLLDMEGRSATVWRIARSGTLLITILLMLLAVLSGSRGGAVGLLIGFGPVLATLSPVSTRVKMTSLGISIGGIVLWLVVSGAASGFSSNPIINSGFEFGKYPWRLDGGSQLVSDPRRASNHVVELVSDGSGWVNMLHYLMWLKPQDDQMELSFEVLPDVNAVSSQAFLRMEALNATGAVLARLTVDGWTDGYEYERRLNMPTAPQTWHRYSVNIDPVPEGTRSLTLRIIGTGDAVRYGLIDDIQLSSGQSTAYTEGPRPFIGRIVGSLGPRYSEMFLDPLTASGGRLEMWRLGAILSFQRPLLGYGIGSEDEIIARYAPIFVEAPSNHLHSVYIKLLVEGGVVLLGVVICVFVAIFATMYGRTRRSPKYAPVLGAFGSLVVMSAFDHVLSNPWILVGMIFLFLGSAGTHSNA